ncbi:MAG: hypothetical protein JW786_11565 [Desulfobacterales bacterium]|nr:hypothetical protein [Desulfobacterales bacterium]
MVSKDPLVIEKFLFPFMIVSESNPLANLMEAQIVSDADSEIKKVFLLIQKEECLLTSDELRPITNKDIEQCWQKAFRFYSDKNQDGSIAILSDQIGADKSLLPFQSLFYCKAEQIFFNPPCPICGLPLQQCYNDDLLIGSGLQPYSTSLRRYLFCPNCLDAIEQTDFYVYKLQVADPPILKDQSDLINGYGRLLAKETHLDAFPCSTCPKQLECYSSDKLAASRIIPFSFYPFFMLVFEAQSIKAIDFLSLISGASPKELCHRLIEKKEDGRVNCLRFIIENDLMNSPFLFDETEKFFLEVLYLKLSFLGELAQTIFSRLDIYRPPDIGLSLDQVWIKLTERAGLLPLFWNFKLSLIDIGADAFKTSLHPQIPPFYALHFLGTVWFYCLLVNRKQSLTDVYAAVESQIVKDASKKELNFKVFIEDASNQLFKPENIFWDPDCRKHNTVENSWESIWEKALNMGCKLLNAGLSADSEWVEKKFLIELEGLREEIKSKLFQQLTVTVQVPAQAPVETENKAIHDILVKIMDKWGIGFTAKPNDIKPSEMGIEEPDETELEKTVVISTQSSKDLEKKVVPQQEQDDEEIRETVILSSDDFDKQTLTPITSEAQEASEDIPETVMISPPKVSEPSDSSNKKEVSSDHFLKKKSNEFEEDDFLAETVILHPDVDKE